MKKYLLLLTIFLLTFKFGNSQTNVYYPFPDSNAVWTEFAQGCCWTDCPGPPTPNPVVRDYNYSYFLQGDTIIKGNSYHKFYQSGSSLEHCAIGNYLYNWLPISKIYAGAYRQDIVLKKMFLISPYDSLEYLLYDFSLNVGDTVIGEGCKVVITSIDSVLTGNNYRKRFNLSTSSNFSIIEGIGSTNGLLMKTLCPFESWGKLICFQNEQNLYPDTITTCGILTNVNEIRKLSSFSIFPNPFSSQTTLLADKILKGANLVVYNSFGQQVKHMKNISGQTITLHRENLSSGLYFIRLTEDDKVITTDKLVIID